MAGGVEGRVEQQWARKLYGYSANESSDRWGSNGGVNSRPPSLANHIMFTHAQAVMRQYPLYRSLCMHVFVLSLRKWRKCMRMRLFCINAYTSFFFIQHQSVWICVHLPKGLYESLCVCTAVKPAHKCMNNMRVCSVRTPLNKCMHNMFNFILPQSSWTAM